MKKEESISGVVVFLFGLVTMLASLKMPLGNFRTPGTGLFPFSLGIILMTLAAMFVVKELISRQDVKGQIQRAAGAKKQLLLSLGVLILSIVLLNPLGYFLAAFFLMAGLLWILGVRGRLFVVLISLFAALTSHVLFVLWLKIPLPRGILGL